MVNTDLDHTLIDALQNPACYPHPVDSVKVLETHISWLLLAGDFAYKIKKPVDFGFLDFSTLARRQFFCHEELRLNRRLAPALYLEVVGIGGSPEAPLFGTEPAFEYAIRMRRFAEEDLLDHRLAQGRLTVKHLEHLAETMAQFHACLPPAAPDSGFGDAEAVAAPARQNFLQLAPLLDESYTDRLAHLQAANEREYQRCLSLFSQRLQLGRVRECHGDLHLGNIVLVDDRPIPFDGIEFNPALRWIDGISDIGFLLMDLMHRQRADLAYALLNAYLQDSGDYDGLGVLRFYLGYRALVMAKVSAIRARQTGKTASLAQCDSYLTLAEQLYRPKRATLIITNGLPGCGKTVVSQIVLEKFQAIRLRSDVERKRLFGLGALERSASTPEGGIYSAEATVRTYRRLVELARSILHHGHSVIVDAAFLKHAERQAFATLAEELAIPFWILAIQSDEALQRQRIRDRQRQGQDASEADILVYETLKTAQEALTTAETQQAISVINNGSLQQLAEDTGWWARLRAARD